MAYQGLKEDHEKLQKENSKMNNPIQHWMKQTGVLYHQSQDNSPSYDCSESSTVTKAQDGLISESTLQQMLRAEKQALAAKHRRICTIHDQYTQAALEKVRRSFQHHQAPSTYASQLPKKSPLTSKLERIALPPLKSVVEKDRSCSLEPLQDTAGGRTNALSVLPPTPSKKSKKKKMKGRRGEKVQRVQTDKRCSDAAATIMTWNVLEEVEAMQTHLREQSLKLACEVRACRGRGATDMSMGEKAPSSLGSLSTVDMETPTELRVNWKVSTPAEVCNPVTARPPLVAPAKSRNNVPQPERFLNLPKVATDSAKQTDSERVHISESQYQVSLQPLSHPEQTLTHAFKLVHSDDWKKKISGLTSLRVLVQNHGEILKTKLHDICLTVVQEVKNLRSGVTRAAMATLGDMYVHLRRAMDSEVEGTARVLLLKTGESSNFIRQDANLALGHMIHNCSPGRVMNGLLAGGMSHRSVAVRSSTAQHLETLTDVVGASRLLTGKKDLTERFLNAVSKLALDSKPEVRLPGRNILLKMATQAAFRKMWQKFVPHKERESLKLVICKLARHLWEDDLENDS